MLKKLIVLVLILTLVSVSVVSVSFASESGTMYVMTDNGKTVNVRTAPSSSAEIIGRLPYGAEVQADWSYAGNDGWTRIFWDGGSEAYIMSRFLVSEEPGPAPDPSKKVQTKTSAKTAEEKLEAELASETAFDQPFYISARPSRPTGWVNFRVGPSSSTARIRSLKARRQLIAIGETNNWYKAQDPDTGRVGYVSKKYMARLNKQVLVDVRTSDGSQKLGTLNVNGEFNLTCKLPVAYKLQVVEVMGGEIIASVLPEDLVRPQMYLSIAFDETYSEVERLNDLTADDLALLEESFQEMNDVAISYGETGYGTKLLIVKEIGSDTDFVDILTIYKGYFIEFHMTPNPKAADQTLTDEQIQMCIDFLTDLEFTPVQ